jgi:hypothetical protein
MRTDNVWENRAGGYIETTKPSGYDILIKGTDKYLNFAIISGATGYGFRDNSGTMEYKNSGGSWAGIGTGGGDMLLGTAQTVTAAKTFNTGTLISPDITGGTAVGSKITYKSTTGIGTPTGIAHQWTGGTNGATVIATMLNNGNVGIGTTSPMYKLDLGDTSLDGNTLRFGVGTRNSTGAQYPAKIDLYVYDANPVNQYLRFYVPNANPNGATEADRQTLGMVINGNGNVGIGTTNPQQALHVFSATNYTGIFISGGSAPNLGFAQSTGITPTWKVGISGNDGTAFSISSGAANTDKLLINSSGNVGIGTTSPSDILSVESNTASTNVMSHFYANGSNSLGGVTVSGTGNGNVYSTMGFGLMTGGAFQRGWAYEYRQGSPQYSFVFRQNDRGAGSGTWYDRLIFDDGTPVTPIHITNTSGMTIPGNVGIGTTNPLSKLEVNGVAAFSLGTALLPSHSFSGDLNTGMWSSGADTINFSNGGAEKVRIDINGNVGIGTTTPTSVLHLKAGTATAGTAPLKFTSGTLLTTPEAGTIEYDGTHLYFTAANAGTRYQLDQQGGGAGDMVLASAQTNSGIKTFLDTTMKLRNVANTFDGYFVNTNTADRIYTLQNRAGTLADDTDLALKANLISPTFTGTPAAPTATAGDSTTQLATTAFVQSAVRSVPSKEASKYATTAALATVTYYNGVANDGVGATLTGVGLGAITLDGNTPIVGDRLLVKNQVSTFQNGIYTVTIVGTAGTVFVITRALDFNQSQDVKTGAATYVTSGATLVATTWDVNSADSPVIGTDAITFIQSAGPGSIIAGTGIGISGVTVSIDSTVATLTGSQALTNKTYNGNTWTAGTGVLTIAAAKTLTVNNTLTLAGTDTSTLNIGTGGTLGTAAYTASTIYPLLAGLAGGQTIAGSTLTTENLTLRANAADLTTGAVIVSSSKEASSSTVGSVQLAGGLAVAKRIYALDMTVTNTITGTTSGNLVSGGALGTPSSGTATNITGLPATAVLAGTLGTGAYVMDTKLTVPQVLTTSNAIAASGNAATVPITYAVNTVTNNSAATLTITMTTTSSIDGQKCIVRILDFSAAAQTITWVNTENSTISAPVTSNGSTTLPVTVAFMYNNATSKWRCVGFA